MIKLAQNDTEVFVKLSKPEFRLLAKTAANNVAENTPISLEWLNKISSFSATNINVLVSAKTQIASAAQTLDTLVASFGV